MDLCETAAATVAAPDERVHIDWYDGIVQAVLVHDTHGAWYAFAVPPGAVAVGEALGPRERWLCLRPLVDRSVLEGLSELETLDDQSWLTRLGIEELLPACGPEGVLVRVDARGAVASCRVLDPDEVAALVPVSAQELVA